MSAPDPSLADLISILKDRSLETGDFLLSSGRRTSRYVDARKTTMSAEGQAIIGSLGLAAIREAGWEPELVGGLTLGADPVAFAIARHSITHPPNIDAFTVRKEPKDHGTGSLIEGCFESGRRVVIVEDVITSGGSALRAAQAVEAAGARILGVLAVVDREEGGGEALSREGLQLLSLVTLNALGSPA